MNRRKLAKLLIAHHLRMSVPDTAGRERLIHTYKEANFPKKMMERGTRCIAVVGAGASSPLLGRSRELADELEMSLGRDEDELERLELVHNFDRDEFETRLIALSRNESAARRVREAISKRYDVAHPTLLCYELLAHLLKHRFIDAIISFNFDELLDQSLHDELAPGEYRRLLSERDCRDLVTDPYHPDYVPLYIKLHGTASETDSLRFTREAYYSLPSGILKPAEELLETEHCVILNVGFGLGSFDFQRLLGKPRKLHLYDLGTPVKTRMLAKVQSERDKSKNRDKDKTAGASTSSTHTPDPPPGYKWLRQCNADERNSDLLLREVLKTIEQLSDDLSGKLLHFRSVLRHEAIASLLGPDRLPSKWGSEPDRWPEERKKYCYRRAILELAFAGAKGRGLLSLGPLAQDRPCHYYDEYRKLSKGKGDDWEALCAAAGLVESHDTPDRLISLKYLRKDRDFHSVGKETAAVYPFNPLELAKHVLKRVKNPCTEVEEQLLAATFKYLQDNTEIELHARDDRVCSKAFKQPMTLTTATAQEIYTWLILRNRRLPEDAVYISDENGDWLLHDAMAEQLEGREHLNVLLAFDDKRQALEAAFSKIKVRVANPWRHNRHMVIACLGYCPMRAIYFARRLRAPAVTPVFLRDQQDVQQLARIFHERWDEVAVGTLARELTLAATRLLDSSADGYVEGHEVALEIGQNAQDPLVFDAFREIHRDKALRFETWPGEHPLPRIVGVGREDSSGIPPTAIPQTPRGK